MSGDRKLRTLALAAAAAAPLAGYALDGRALAWPLLGLVALAAGIPWRRAPRPAVALTSTFHATVIVAVVLLVALSRHAPILRDSIAEPLLAAEGVAAALLVTLFFAGRAIWAPSRHLLPAAATLLVVTGMRLQAPAYLPLAALTALAFWAYALASGGPRTGPGRQLAFAIPALALAAGLVVLLPWAQPHVEGYVARLLSNEAASGLSDTTRLGDISRLALSRRVVLRLWTSPSASGTWLLRTHVFTDFDGRDWRVATTLARSPLPRSGDRRLPAGPLGALLSSVPGPTFALAPASPPAASSIPRGGRVLLSQVAPGALPLSADATLVKLDDVAPAVNTLGLVRPQFLPPRIYGFATAPDEAAGAAADIAADPGAGAALALPAKLDPRTVALAGQLAREAGPSPRARLEHTVAHLQVGYRYTLEPGEFTGEDPLAEFLFVKRQAYCEYFASAAAVLLRLQGVPTRYVKGLSVGPHDRVGDHHVVREADAHAWIEAWIPGHGWTEADPTPPAQFAALHAPDRPRWLERAQEALAVTAQEAWARIVAADWAGLVGLAAQSLAALGQWFTTSPLAAGALATALVAWLARRALARRLRRGRVTSVAAPRLQPDLARLGRELEAFWRRLGHPRPASRGLLEHAARVRAAGALADACGAGEEAAREYYACAFGGRPPVPATLQALAARLRAARA